jgi:hypothetical protein
MMCALGLLRGNEAGLNTPIAVAEIIDQLLDDGSWVTNIGDLGLLLWVCAACSRAHLERFHSVFPLHKALDQYRGARVRVTMELAWFLTGLTFARAVNGVQPPYLERIASQVCEMLRTNQGPLGLFGHMARRKSVAGLIRGHVGSFADQVYPVIAMSHYGRVFGSEEAYLSAEKCASMMCRLQGPLGQWWWHYNSLDGSVVERYPVYSVHQHGMGPMALHAVQATVEFQSYINKGLEWIDGSNELGRDMKHPSASLVWRSISETPLARCSARFGLSNPEQTADRLRVLHECRSYEMGWLLYGLADRAR